MDIFNLNVQGFLWQPLPVILVIQKQSIVLLVVAICCICYRIFIYYYSPKIIVLPFAAFCYSPIAANESEVTHIHRK